MSILFICYNTVPIIRDGTMSILQILEYPDPKLREIAKPVTVFDNKLQEFVSDMFDTMYGDRGAGLAATQVGVNQRVITIDFSPDKSKPLVFINPEIIEYEGTMQHAEGCLSIPGFWVEVERHAWLKVRAFDQHGEEFELEAEGVDGESSLAGCIQHEMDHLQGKLFVDYLSAVKRDRIRKKLEKLQRTRM